MERWPKIKRLARVEFTPDEFVRCISTVEESMRQRGSRDPRLRLELTGAFFGEEQQEKALAFTARVACMMEIAHSEKIGGFTVTDPQTGKSLSRVGLFHAAALAELQYDHDKQFFDEDEFLAILKLEDAMLAKTTQT